MKVLAISINLKIQLQNLKNKINSVILIKLQTMMILGILMTKIKKKSMKKTMKILVSQSRKNQLKNQMTTLGISMKHQ